MMIDSHHVSRLHQAVVTKIKPTEPLDAKSPKVPELEELSALCLNENARVSHAACRAVVSLVEESRLQLQFGLDKMILAATTGRNICAAVHGITLLLALQSKVQGSVDSPYGIRSPPHPYITVLCNRAEAWTAVYQEMALILSHKCGLTTGRVRTLDCCIRFVLLDPNTRHHLMRSNLLQLVADVINADKTSSVPDLKKLILAIIPAMPVSQDAQCFETTQFLIRLLSSDDAEFRREVALQLLSLSYPMAMKGLDLTDTLDAVIGQGRIDPTFLSSGEMVPLLRMLVTDAAGHHLPVILELALFAIPVSPCPAMLTPCLLYSLYSVRRSASPGVNSARVQRLLDQCLKAVDEAGLDEQKVRGEEPDVTSRRLSPNPDVYFYRSLTRLATDLPLEPTLCHDWLNELLLLSTKEKLTNEALVTDVVFVVVTRAAERHDTFTLALRVLVRIAEVEQETAAYILPIILFVLKRESDQRRKLDLLNSLPQLATHKGVVGSILRTCQSLSNHRSMRPLAVRLMCALWRKQERCYQYLVRVLGENEGEAGQSLELMVAKAATVRDVCRYKPHQHSEEMLPLISSLLQSATHEDEVMVAALVLEAIYWLCESDAIDLKTMWKVMSATLTQDSRPLILCKVCELFSLAPRLNRDSAENEEFQMECVKYLWYLSQCGVEIVQRSAFLALAEFETDLFTVEHLPCQIVDEAEKEEMKVVRGESYLKVMDCLPENVMRDDYEPFLTSLIARELDKLPRSIHHSRIRRRAQGSGARVLGNVPATIQALYDRPDNPGLRPSLALGLLYSFDPAVPVGRDGRPRKHHLIAHGKHYQQMLQTLLLEVPIEPLMDYSTLSLPSAWSGYMARLYQVTLEARRADVNLQLQQGKCSDDRAEEDLRVAWLWVRDKLTELLKSASRGNVLSQANGLLALSGLVSAVNDHVTGLEDQCKDRSEYLATPHWTMIVTESVFAVVDVNFVPTTKIIPWGQTGSSASANVLVQCSACLCLPLFVPILHNRQEPLLEAVLAKLSKRIQSRRMPPQLAQCYGQALGTSLAILCQSSQKQQEKDHVQSALKQLQTTAFDSKSPNNRNGVVLGLGFAVSALFSDSDVPPGDSPLKVMERLLAEVTSAFGECAEAQCLSVSVIASAAYSANAITGDRVAAIADSLFRLQQQYKERFGVSLALGSLCHQMKRQGLTAAQGIYKALFDTWSKLITVTSVSIGERKACLYGLYGLAGSCPHPITNLSDPGPMENETSALVRLSLQALSGGEAGLRPIYVQYLTLLYSVQTTGGLASNSVPVNYDYLGEESTIRSVYQHILTAVEASDDVRLARLLRCTVAGCGVDDNTQRHLPPCDWHGVLSTIMRSAAPATTKTDVIRLAVCQVEKNSFAGFVSTWMAAPLVATLPNECLTVLYSSIAILCRKLPPARVAAFLHDPCSAPFRRRASTTNASTRSGHVERTSVNMICVLEGMRDALKERALPDVLLPEFSKALKAIYKTFDSDTEHSVYTAFAQCLAQTPDDVIDDVTMLDLTAPPDGVNYKLGLKVRALLVEEGAQPIGLLNASIDAVIQEKDGSSSDLSSLVRCLVRAGADTTESGSQARLQWFTEFMGHLYNSAKVDQRLVLICLELFCLVARAWSNRNVALTSSTSRHMSDTPASLVDLLTSRLWETMTDKLLTWLVSMSALPGGRQLDGCLLALKTSQEYAKAKHWTTIVSTMC